MNHEDIIREVARENQIDDNIQFIDYSLFNDKSYLTISNQGFFKFMDGFNERSGEHLVFKVIDDSHINGFAFHRNGYNYICINAGTLLEINDLVLKMTAHRDFFPNIYQNEDYQSIFNGGAPSIQNIDGEPKLTFNNGTDDIHRQDLAFIISFFAVNFIYFHEAGHLIDGHCKWLAHVHHCDLIEMVGANHTYNNLDSQTIELDADAFAANRTFAQMIEGYESMHEMYPEVVGSLNDLIQFWIIGLTIIFIKFGIHPLTPEQISKGDYLPNAYRWVQAVDSGHTFMTMTKIGKYNFTVDEFHNMVIPTFKKCLEINNIVNSDNYTGIVDAVKQMQESIPQYEKVKQNWNKIRPELEKFALMGLSPLYEISKNS